MRQLTSKQKKLLNQWLKEAQPTTNMTSIFGIKNKIFSFNSLSPEQQEKLEQINDTEILYQEVNRFISDWRFNQN